MEKTFATCHFSIILISLMVRVMPNLDFLAHDSTFTPLKSFSTQDHYILYCSKTTNCNSI